MEHLVALYLCTLNCHFIVLLFAVSDEKPAVILNFIPHNRSILFGLLSRFTLLSEFYQFIYDVSNSVGFRKRDI